MAKKLIKKATKGNTKSGRIITVKNADGDADTKAKILIQNKIKYTPRVSVIIPVYNVEKYLRECLDSVVNQTLREIEIICVDDGSTDSSLEILKEYAARDNRITVITQKNLHAGVARNAGLAVAKGEYLSFLDSDDFFELNMLEEMYNTAETKKCDIVVFNYDLFDDKAKKHIAHEKYDNRYIKNSPFAPQQYADELFFIAPPNPWTKLFRKELVTKNNIKFESCVSCNDITFVDTALGCSNSICVVNDVFAHYRMNSDTNISANREQHAMCILHAFTKLRNNLVKLRLYDKYHNVYTGQALTRFYGEVKNAQKNIRDKFITVVKSDFPEVYDKLIEKLRPAVSVIIPVYNTEKYLAECLDSVINQTLTNIEIICVNDGSTDGSLKILQEYAKKDNRINIITQKNRGLGATRNVGIDNAIGQYVTFLDSDDYINQCYCEVLYNKAITDKADIAATAKMVRFDFENKKTEKYLGIKDNDILSANDKCKIFLASGTCCNKIYKTDFIKMNNIHMFDKKSIGEDNIFTIVSCVYANKIAVCNSAVYYYRINPKSITNVRTSKRDFDVIEMYLNTLDKVKQADIVQFDKSVYIKAIHERMYIDLYNIAKSFESTLQQEFYKKLDELFPKLVISLTSYPARINTVNQTIETLLNQTKKADKVILWLAPEQFPNREKDLPKQLLDLCNKGLTIDWYHDIKSYKKLIPALQKYPDAIIVTADDDLLYPDYWLESLYSCYMSDHDVIWCHRAHAIQMNTYYKILPYKNWHQNIQKSQVSASYFNFCTTGGGVLYPPHCFYPDVLQESVFMELAPNADDIWFWAMLILNHKKIKTVSHAVKKLTYVDDTQNTALWHQNVNGGQNDIQLANVIKKYPQILKILIGKKKTNIKPYLLFPYYLLATMWMKWIYIPILKFIKHMRAIWYSRSHRGKMDMLNNNFRQLLKTVQVMQSQLNKKIDNLDSKYSKSSSDMETELRQVVDIVNQINPPKKSSRRKKHT